MFVRLSTSAPPSLRALGLTLLVAAGCAHHKAGSGTTRPGASEVRMDEEEIRGNVELANMNDEELFACGEAADAAGDVSRAAECFGRLADLHPGSRHFRAATLRAGIALEKLEQWELARERFASIADAAKGQGDAVEASFRLAETQYHLKRFPEAAQLLRTLSGRAELSATRRLEAQVLQGVCELESGDSSQAEQTLRAALDAYHRTSEPTEDDTRFASQGQFFLGEIFRLQYQKVALVADKPAEELGRDLELKAQLLLSAQGHYLRAIKLGNGYWGTAAGSQIGAMYQDLYEQLVNAPAPRELAGEEIELYRQEVRKKLRVLLSKAINVYERTLEAAERVGSAGPFIERTRESLKRMKDLMVAESGEDPDASGRHGPRG